MDERQIAASREFLECAGARDSLQFRRSLEKARRVLGLTPLRACRCLVAPRYVQRYRRTVVALPDHDRCQATARPLARREHWKLCRQTHTRHTLLHSINQDSEPHTRKLAPQERGSRDGKFSLSGHKFRREMPAIARDDSLSRVGSGIVVARERVFRGRGWIPFESTGQPPG